MEKGRVKTKASKKKVMKNLIIELNLDIHERLEEIAKLAAVTISQAVSVMMATTIIDLKSESKPEGYSGEKWTMKKDSKGKKEVKKESINLFGLGK